MIRTSLTHPLSIDVLPLANGEIGLTFCPGKQGDSVFGAPWARDLDLDLQAIKAWGTHAVLTLIEEHEFDMLGVRGLGQAVKAQGMAWHHMPIADLGVLDATGLATWTQLSPQLHTLLERGGKLVIHCRGGLGRAGTMAALLLIERGRDVRRAIADVRAARPGAIETFAQESFLRQQGKPFDARMRKVHASLIGGAMGDSLGAEIEFRSLAEIRRRFPTGLRDLPPHQGLRGAITDDSQMVLFTFEGITRAMRRYHERRMCHPPSVIHAAYLRWLRTQNGHPRVQTDDAGLIADRRLWAQRAPGMTCLSALEASQRLGQQAANDSKGCGTIMRIAPVGLLIDRPRVRQMALEVAGLTHGHPTGQWAAAAWAKLLADVLAGKDLETAAKELAQKYAAVPEAAETVAAIRAALTAPRDGRPETVEAFGGGWIAEEALAIGLYACLASDDVEEALRIAVTHSGDSDSTGAIAGHMLGIVHPDAVLNHPWAEVVEGADIMRRLVLNFIAEAAAPEQDRFGSIPM